MSKFNTATVATARGRGPIVAEQTPTIVTHEGARAYARDARSELFMLGVTNMVGEDTFYETAEQRDTRFAALVRQVAIEDVDWLTRFVRWLRTGANMRSAPLVAAAEGVRARLAEGLHGGNRALIAAAMDRADEPGELLAYWVSRYGRALPMPVKRGIADAALRLYAEYPLLKYDTGTHGVRFADVLTLCHPGDQRGSSQRRLRLGEWQRDLFAYAIDRRHGRGDVPPETLAKVRANADLRELAAGDPQVLLDTDRLRAAGMTWEDVLSLVGSKVSKAALWEALIPVMGLMALARNLRNFDQAGVSDQVAEQVMARFADPEQVARSRMFPYRWLAAYENAPSLRWGHALDTAMRLSLANLPDLDDSQVYIDTSDSMNNRMAGKSTMSRVKAAAVFGVSLAARSGATLIGFANSTFVHEVPAGASVIREVDRFVRRTGEVGHGTYIAAALRTRYAGQRRVFLFSDMQTMDHDVSRSVPDSTALYGFNLAGYRPTAIPSGTANRTELGGLTDATFKMVPLIEAGRRADWPF